MSIKGNVTELNEINAEIKHLQLRIRQLKAKGAQTEQTILDYLREKEQPGVKYQGTAVIVQKKPKRLHKANKDKDRDAILILQENGIRNPEEVLKDVLRARKGNETEVQKLKIIKQQETNEL